MTFHLAGEFIKSFFSQSYIIIPIINLSSLSALLCPRSPWKIGMKDKGYQLSLTFTIHRHILKLKISIAGPIRWIWINCTTKAQSEVVNKFERASSYQFLCFLTPDFVRIRRLLARLLDSNNHSCPLENKKSRYPDLCTSIKTTSSAIYWAYTYSVGKLLFEFQQLVNNKRAPHDRIWIENTFHLSVKLQSATMVYLGKEITKRNDLRTNCSWRISRIFSMISVPIIKVIQVHSNAFQLLHTQIVNGTWIYIDAGSLGWPFEFVICAQ